jgi:hypothetical protein
VFKKGQNVSMCYIDVESVDSLSPNGGDVEGSICSILMALFMNPRATLGFLDCSPCLCGSQL